MRTTNKVLATVGVTAVALATMAGTALAEPTSTPPDSSIVAVGSDTIQALGDQFQADFANFYSYDSVPAGNITPKENCAAITRPSGSGSGIAALGQNTRPAGDTTDYCIDLARSSRLPVTTGTSPDPTGLAWVQIATDAVTWSAESATNLPTNLTTTQLQAIYSCDASILGNGASGPVTENEIGGTGTDAVVPVIPQSTSGTRSFFLSKIGVSTLGSCVQGLDNSVEENEGTNAIFGRGSSVNTKDIVFPFSVAVYLSETVHNNGDATNNPGPLVLKSVNGVKPTTGANAKTVINKKFPYIRQVYLVTRNAGTTAKPKVPTYLQALIGNNNNKGSVCSKTGLADDVDYGFLSLAGKCGKIVATT